MVANIEVVISMGINISIFSLEALSETTDKLSRAPFNPIANMPRCAAEWAAMRTVSSKPSNASYISPPDSSYFSKTSLAMEAVLPTPPAIE